MSPPPSSLYEVPFTTSPFVPRTDTPDSSRSASQIPDGYIAAKGLVQAPHSNQYSSGSYSAPYQPSGSTPDQYLAEDLYSHDAPYVQSDEEDDSETKLRSQVHKRNVKPKSDQPQSKRAAKRAQVIEASGSVGANNKPKGRTRMQHGTVLEWWDKDDQIWRAAAPHDKYRHDFIVHGNALGSYDIAPERGVDADDVTSYCSALGQQHWNIANRNSWGNIVDQEGNKVLFLLEKPDHDEDPPEADRFLLHNGLVLLDPDDHPVKDFGPGVPFAFSSKIEGGRIEAFRRIYNMTLLDCRARMPRNIKNKAGDWKPLFGITSLNQRTSRFRDEFDAPAWRSRELKKHTKKRLRQEGLQNGDISTEGLTPLSKLEIEKRKLAGRGKHLSKAMGRAISQEERDERDHKFAKGLRKLEEKERRRSGVADQYQRGQDTASTDNPSSSSPPSNKRKRDFSASPASQDESLPASQKRLRFDSVSPIYPSLQSMPSPPYRSDFGQLYNYQASVSKAQHPAVAQETTLNQQLVENNSSASEMVDLRYRVPQTPAEQLSIRTALLPTRLDFRSQNGREPPETSIGTSYISQYSQLQASHDIGHTGPEAPRQLVGVGTWYGTFALVPTPQLSDENYSDLLQPSSNADSSSTTNMLRPAGGDFGTGMPQFVHMPNMSGQDMWLNDFENEDWTAGFLNREVFHDDNAPIADECKL